MIHFGYLLAFYVGILLFLAALCITIDIGSNNKQ